MVNSNNYDEYSNYADLYNTEFLKPVSGEFKVTYTSGGMIKGSGPKFYNHIHFSTGSDILEKNFSKAVSSWQGITKTTETVNVNMGQLSDQMYEVLLGMKKKVEYIPDVNCIF